MSVTTRAYDKTNSDGLPSDPVVVLVAEGTHDISRLVNALARGNSEQGRYAQLIARQLRRHNGGRAALRLLKQHGGPDFTATEPGSTDPTSVYITDVLDRAQKCFTAMLDPETSKHTRYADTLSFICHVQTSVLLENLGRLDQKLADDLVGWFERIFEDGYAGELVHEWRQQIAAGRPMHPINPAEEAAADEAEDAAETCGAGVEWDDGRRVCELTEGHDGRHKNGNLLWWSDDREQAALSEVLADSAPVSTH